MWNEVNILLLYGSSGFCYSFHAACGCFLPRWRWYSWWYGHRMALLRVWEGFKQLRVFPVWWGLVLAFGSDILTSLPVVSYASRAALIASSFEIGSQWLGAWMGLTSGSWLRPTGGQRKLRPWKSELQFLERNSGVQVPGVGQTRIDVSGGGGGGPAAYTWWLPGSVVSGWGGLLVEHFLMKSARRGLEGKLTNGSDWWTVIQ